MKIGQTIHFTLTNNPTNEYDAKVFSIGSSFENESKTIAVHCTVTGNKIGLIDGMNITGIVSLSNALTPAVPNEAIVNADGKDYIFVVTDKKRKNTTKKKAKNTTTKVKTVNTAMKKTATSILKIEVVKGVSNMGYTAITFVQDIPANAQIVIKGAFLSMPNYLTQEDTNIKNKSDDKYRQKSQAYL